MNDVDREFGRVTVRLIDDTVVTVILIVWRVMCLLAAVRAPVVVSISKRRAPRVPRPTVGGGEARPLGCVSFFKHRDALLRCGTHVIGLAKSAHLLRGKTRCRPKDGVFRDHEKRRFSNDAGPVSRPRGGRTFTDTPATTATDDLCCGGNPGVCGCHWSHASPRRDKRGRN